MIELKEKKSFRRSIKNVDRHKNILIIAPAETEHEVGNICFYVDEKNVLEAYGDSELYRAYMYAKRKGINGIFLMNVKRYSDYINCTQAIYQNDFSYIVPIGVKFSDTFIDEQGRRRPFVYEYINSVNQTSNSVFVMTDEHSVLYESLDHFCDDMSDKVRYIMSMANSWYDGKHMILVASNLRREKYANLVLACAMCTTEVGEYPEISNDCDTCINPDWFDFKGLPISFFRKDIEGNVSIESLNNMRIEKDAISDANIYRTISFLLRDLDMSHYEGKLHSERIMHAIRKKLEEYFTSKKGKYIRDFSIASLIFNKIAPAAGRVEAIIDVLPINSIERYTLELVF